MSGARTRRRSSGALACVLREMDVVTPLGLAGIPCVAVVGPDDPARWSRFVQDTVEAGNSWREPQAFAEQLTAWAARQPAAPVLYYCTDADLLMVSRYRDTLATAFAIAIPEAELVEDLVDKQRFMQLARRVGLPVPWTGPLSLDRAPRTDDVPEFPVIIKPVVHRGTTALMARDAKAVSAANLGELHAVWERAVAAGVDCLVQQLVPGSETAIVSYHAYVDRGGETVADFTGVKIRTYPPEYGQSTAVAVTLSEDVLAEGRRVIAAIGLRNGVAKADFKRGPDGRLWLLEVNPRYSLWHHPAAVAGVNVPALVHADLTGTPRPSVGPLRDGVTWCSIPGDRKAAAAAGIPMLRHLLFLAGSDARRSGAWSDPGPVLRGRVLPALRRLVR
jgi:D-aspartate ligase